MFYCTLNDTYINEGTQFEIEGQTFPSVWLNQSTPEQKAELGLVEVIATNQPYNPVYYWTGETLDGATLTYTGTPKDLADVQKQAVAQVNQSTYAILLPTDYMASRAFETGTPIASNWATWRASIRAYAANATAVINASTTVDEVAVIMSGLQWPSDPNALTNPNDIANLMGN